MSRNKQTDLNIIKQAAKLYKENLLNKNIMFIYLKNNKVEFYEVTFKEEHFKHLTGVTSNCNAYKFFYKASNNRLSLKDFTYTNSTTYLKLDNLIKAMLINRYVKMIGDFKHNKIYLSVKKIAGNNNLFLGFDEGIKINYPKTLLVGDIRDYSTEKPYKIIGILTKKVSEITYSNVTYIAKNTTLNRFFSNKELSSKLNPAMSSCTFYD